MSLLENLIKKHCPDGVEYKNLISVCDIKRGERITKKDITENGIFPVVSGGQFPMGMYDKFNRNENTITISSYGAAGYVNYQTKKFWANDVCLSLYPKYNLVNKFLYYYLKFKQDFLYSKTTNAIPNHIPTDIIKELPIPVPPIEVQKEIVRILDEFTLKTAELQELLHKEYISRKKQYEYYRDKLLTFGDDVEWKNLSEIAEIGTGSSNTNEEIENGKYPFFVRSQEVRSKNEYEYDETAIITSGDGVGVGKIFHYVEGKYALHQRAYRIHIIDKNVIPKYYFYYMKTTFLSYIEKTSFHSSVTSIRRPMLNNYPVPVPPLEEQERIVKILDRFDALCNDISSGLPAEIEMRKKQYEYYRDKLLTFKEKKIKE